MIFLSVNLQWVSTFHEMKIIFTFKVPFYHLVNRPKNKPCDFFFFFFFFGLWTVENWLLYNYLWTHLFHICSQLQFRGGEKAIFTLVQVLWLSAEQVWNKSSSLPKGVHGPHWTPQPSAILALNCSSHPSPGDTATLLHAGWENSWEPLSLCSYLT